MLPTPEGIVTNSDLSCSYKEFWPISPAQEGILTSLACSRRNYDQSSSLQKEFWPLASILDGVLTNFTHSRKNSDQTEFWPIPPDQLPSSSYFFSFTKQTLRALFSLVSDFTSCSLRIRISGNSLGTPHSFIAKLEKNSGTKFDYFRTIGAHYLD